MHDTVNGTVMVENKGTIPANVYYDANAVKRLSEPHKGLGIVHEIKDFVTSDK